MPTVIPMTKVAEITILDIFISLRGNLFRVEKKTISLNELIPIRKIPEQAGLLQSLTVSNGIN